MADADLPEGHVIREQEIWARRLGLGEIPAYDFAAVVGRRLMLDVTRNAQLRWSDLS